MNKFIIVLLILARINVCSSGQFSVSEIYGAKTNALGTCLTNLQGMQCTYGNVAGLSDIKNFGMDFNVENRFQTFNLSSVGFGIAKNLGKTGILGLTLKRFGISEYNELQAGLNYARKLGSNFSIGLRLNMYNLVIEEYGNRFTANADVGLQYQLNDKFSIGFYVINPFPVKFIEDINLPTIAFIGVKYSLSKNMVVLAELEKHFDFNYVIKAGLQLDLNDKLSIYGGFRNDMERFSDYSLGIKFDFNDSIQLNLSTQYNLTFGISPGLAISYNLE
jgi:hypothetical protein